MLKRSQLLPVPLTRQATNYTCGVAALQAVLGYYGQATREDGLAAALAADPDKGTNYRRIVAYARASGLEAEAHEDVDLAQLRAWVAAGRPVIVAIQAWAEAGADYAVAWDDGHYVVIVGCDGEHVYCMDPSTLGHYTYLPVGEFVARWHDCFLEADGREVRLERLAIVFAGQRAYDPETLQPLG